LHSKAKERLEELDSEGHLALRVQQLTPSKKREANAPVGVWRERIGDLLLSAGRIRKEDTRNQVLKRGGLSVCVTLVEGEKAGADTSQPRDRERGPGSWQGGFERGRGKKNKTEQLVGA